MKAILFNGSLDEESFRTSRRLTQFFADQFAALGIEVQQIHLSDYQIPIYHPRDKTIPESVQKFADTFVDSDIQIWLSPLYHGGMAGVMKNALDWLEITATNKPAYLTNKVIGLACWSAGNQAMQGIQAMDNVVKALRGWSLPYQIPISNMDLYQDNDLADFYKSKMKMMVDLLVESQAK
ncbi:NADPH-dependent FMN reductase [Flavobacterium sp. NKUCC04_CG]|uniref:NADPH-dependent FMN reductase n=1 Tax=Flavobacterium sp. NKUCC04_CG TaxID=2842121 RepID=UPI001C5AB15A|nr:NAD(P)H-dependent oxidoreductase [Flavobacterium sp. NKUCC04_CG]MBW3517889.1 NAD(P)H-dependent oxidoreductase [Flavobacterium sp. NKUCC04_CG]